MKVNNKKKGAWRRKLLVLPLACFLLAANSQQVGAEGAVDVSKSSSVQQDEIKIQGMVTDSNGEALIGVSVTEKGSTRGTITDFDGSFSFAARSSSSELVFTYIGYIQQAIVVGNKKSINVQLLEDTQMLDELVVVGFGTQKKENLTGAVASISMKDAIGNRPVTDVAKALQGASPGLSITTNAGGVGTESNIRLRGSVGSLSAASGTSPLILLDNVEIPSLNLVNPDDIESISVLKDAASASIYGTRAAWGVILITSKTGKQNEKVLVSYSNNFAWSTPTDMPKQSKTYENAEFLLAIAARDNINTVSSIGYNIDRESVQKMRDWHAQYGGESQGELGEMMLGRDFENRGGSYYFYREFDPVKEFTRKWTPQQNHNVSIRGGGQQTSYNLSLAYLNQTGVMKFNSDKYDRFNLNSNITSNVKDWWKVRANMMFTRSANETPYKFAQATAGPIFDEWYYLLRWPSFYPYATYEGKDFRSSVADIKQAKREEQISNYTRLNLGSEFNITKDLSLNLDYTFGLLNNQEKREGGVVMAYNFFDKSNPFDYRDVYGGNQNKVMESSRYTVSNTFKAYATYDKTFDQASDLKLMTGMDAETRDRRGHYSERRGLVNLDQPEIALAVGDQYSSAWQSYHNDFAAMGFFGRVNYSYHQKYLFELNARYDGSSRFPKGNKWGFFPSTSLGWRVSEEAFMEPVKPVMSTLKMRGSWGTIGNQDVAANSFLSIMGVNTASGWLQNGKQLPFIGAPSVMSPSLSWERVSTIDIGLDARFYKDKIGLVFDWYQRTTSDMHSPGQTMPSSFGASAPQINFGEMQATGIEIGVDFNHRFASGMGIGMRANISKVVEKITKYNNTTNNIYGYYAGKRLGEIWGYETDRLFQESDFNSDGSLIDGIASQHLIHDGAFKLGPGDVKYKNLDGDNSTIGYGKNTLEDHGDLKVIGNALPNFEYSFAFNIDYKGFDFSAFFQGVGSRDYWVSGVVGIPGFMPQEILYAHQTDYWTPENTGAFYPRPTNHSWGTNKRNFQPQSKYLLKMGYLRCKNITLGYNLPQQLVNKLQLGSLRVFSSIENAFEFTNMHLPVDPETTGNKYSDTGGNSFGRSYPFMRTVSFGAQLTF